MTGEDKTIKKGIRTPLRNITIEIAETRTKGSPNRSNPLLTIHHSRHYWRPETSSQVSNLLLLLILLLLFLFRNQRRDRMH